MLRGFDTPRFALAQSVACHCTRCQSVCVLCATDIRASVDHSLVGASMPRRWGKADARDPSADPTTFAASTLRFFWSTDHEQPRTIQSFQ